MATINVIQPQAGWGTITVLDSTPSHYTVAYNPPSPTPEGLVFYGFSVYCHACHQTLLHSSSYTAVFDIASLETSGHPGPFDVSAVLRVFWDLEIYTAPDDSNRGSTSPTSYVREYIPLGQRVSLELTATANEGWEFSHWTNDDDSTWKSTNRKVTVSYTSNEADDLIVVRYTAHFTRPQISVDLRSRGIGVTLSTARADPDVEGRRIVTNGSQYDYQDKIIGYLYKEGKYARGSVATFTFTMMPYGISKGYVALGWEVVKSSSDIEYFDMTNSFTYELPDQAEITIRILIGENTDANAILITDTSAYGYATLGSGSHKIGTKDIIGTRGERVHVEKYRVTPRFGYTIYASQIGTKDGLRGGYHGCSVDGAYIPGRIEHLQEGQMIETVVIPETAAGGEVVIVVFMCSHALIHNDDTGKLEYRNNTNWLVYECYIPALTTAR